MNVYIFERVAKLTTRWHPGGGLVVIARDDAHAWQLITEHEDARYKERIGTWGELLDEDKEIDLDQLHPIKVSDKEWERKHVSPLAYDEEPRVFVFEDSGCC